MGDVSKGEGRTVLFVSHNMASIKALCNKGIFLDKGFIRENSTVDKAIQLYFSNNIKNEFFYENNAYKFIHFKVIGENGQEKINISNGEEFYFEFNLEIKNNKNNKVYIGQSIDIEKRKIGHFCSMRLIFLCFLWHQSVG